MRSGIHEQHRTDEPGVACGDLRTVRAELSIAHGILAVQAL